MTVDFIIVTMRREDAPTSFGRQKILRLLKEGLPVIGCCPHWVTMRQPRIRLWALAIGITRWIWQVLSGRALPLQSILALQGRVHPLPLGNSDNLGTEVPLPVVYIDGVRLAHCGTEISRRIGGRLVVDFDDLLSRRIARMMRRREDLSFGAFSMLVPRTVGRLVRGLGPFQTGLLSLEKHLVRRSEMRAAQTADALVFTSQYEAKLFQRFLRRHAPDLEPKYLILGPVSKLTDSPEAIIQRAPPDKLRFIFIGSDVLEQNRVAIQAIVDLDKEGVLALPTFIYGQMTRTYSPSGNVKFLGFAEALSLVYQPGSILLLPRSVRGGIKTKVLEAFEHGIPTIGTDCAFEGFEGCYPWRLDEVDLRRLVANKSQLRESYQKALATGVAMCAKQFSSERYWNHLKTYVSVLPSGELTSSSLREGLCPTSQPRVKRICQTGPTNSVSAAR